MRPRARLGKNDRVANHGWTAADLPDLGGMRAVVTGANSGLGLYTSLELARRGARVVLAVRDGERGAAAAEQIRGEVPGAAPRRPPARPRRPRLGARVRRACGEHERLDLLVNNAGVMAIPRRATADGFELQFGTNHLGHFALTGLLLPALVRGELLGGPARVVTVSSTLHRRGRLDRDDLMGERSYSPWRAYGQSKLANLLFMRELQRRVDAAGLRLLSVAAHPGYASTNLQLAGPRMRGSRARALFYAAGNLLFAQPAAHGAWPTLCAATDPGARGGEYYGPGGLAEQRGHPVLVGMSAAASDAGDAGWLWERSEELTGVSYP